MPIKLNIKGAELSDDEKKIVDKLFNEYEMKVKRQLKNSFDILVHIKIHGEGNSKRYNIHVDVEGAFKFGASADDFDLAKAIHKSMNKIMSEIEHKFHVSNQHDKKR